MCQADGESSYRQFGEKRSALSELYMAEFGNLALYVAVSGADEKLNFIGYPSETGNGAQLLMRNLIGITNNCRDKRAAWDFIKTFYIEPDDYSMEYLDRGFSAGRAKFDALCEKAQKEKAGRGDHADYTEPGTDISGRDTIGKDQFRGTLRKKEICGKVLRNTGDSRVTSYDF